MTDPHKAARRAMELPPDMPMWQWAERYIVLGVRQPTANKGPYRTDLTPYVRGVFDAIDDPGIHTVTIKKGAQTGLSLVVHCAICYWVCEDPDPILLVLPNEKIGQSISETRLQPLIEDSPYVAKQLTDDPDDFKKLQYELKHCVVNIVGSNSPANLASRPVRFLVCDEVDKFPEQTGKEAKAVNLAEQRTKTYEIFRKIVKNSTPTNTSGHITQSHAAGDQRRYFVPCPKCKLMQVIEWKRIKFDSKAPIHKAAKGAYYLCQNEKCGRKWSDSDKRAAVEKGEWRPTAEATDPGHASFHLPSFYSPWVNWADIVTKFLSSLDSPDELQDFVNSELGMEWTPPPIESIDAELILARQAACDYPQGTVPTADPVIVGATVDVQKQHLVYSVWAMNMENQWLIDHGLLSTQDNVPDLFEKVYFDETGKELQVWRILCDAAYETTEVYKLCLAERRVVPIVGLHGVDFKPSEYLVPKQINSMPGAKGKLFPGRAALTLYHLHPSEYKNRLSRAIAGKGPVQIWFHNGIMQDEAYVAQMCGEVKRETKPDRYGQVHTYWEKVATNDYFDLAQYGFAFRHMLTNQLNRLNRQATNDEPESDGPAKKAQKQPEPDGPVVQCRYCGHKPMTARPIQGGHECPNCRRFQRAGAQQHRDKFDEDDDE